MRLQNEFGDSRFFYVFNIILSFSTCSQSFKNICTWEILKEILKEKTNSEVIFVVWRTTR